MTLLEDVGDRQHLDVELIDFAGLPNVPTIPEVGYTPYEAESWNGVLAPAETRRTRSRSSKAGSRRRPARPS